MSGSRNAVDPKLVQRVVKGLDPLFDESGTYDKYKQSEACCLNREELHKNVREICADEYPNEDVYIKAISDALR